MWRTCFGDAASQGSPMGEGMVRPRRPVGMISVLKPFTWSTTEGVSARGQDRHQEPTWRNPGCGRWREARRTALVHCMVGTEVPFRLLLFGQVRSTVCARQKCWSNRSAAAQEWDVLTKTHSLATATSWVMREKHPPSGRSREVFAQVRISHSWRGSGCGDQKRRSSPARVVPGRRRVRSESRRWSPCYHSERVLSEDPGPREKFRTVVLTSFQNSVWSPQECSVWVLRSLHKHSYGSLGVHGQGYRNRCLFQFCSGWVHRRSGELRFRFLQVARRKWGIRRTGVPSHRRSWTRGCHRLGHLQGILRADVVDNVASNYWRLLRAPGIWWIRSSYRLAASFYDDDVPCSSLGRGCVRLACDFPSVAYVLFESVSREVDELSGFTITCQGDVLVKENILCSPTFLTAGCTVTVHSRLSTHGTIGTIGTIGGLIATKSVMDIIRPQRFLSAWTKASSHANCRRTKLSRPCSYKRRCLCQRWRFSTLSSTVPPQAGHDSDQRGKTTTRSWHRNQKTRRFDRNATPAQDRTSQLHQDANLFRKTLLASRPRSPTRALAVSTGDKHATSVIKLAAGQYWWTRVWSMYPYELDSPRTLNPDPHRFVPLTLPSRRDTGLLGRCYHQGVADRELHEWQQLVERLGKCSFAFTFSLGRKKEERERGVTIPCSTKDFFPERWHCTFRLFHEDVIQNKFTGALQGDIVLWLFVFLTSLGPAVFFALAFRALRHAVRIHVGDMDFLTECRVFVFVLRRSSSWSQCRQRKRACRAAHPGQVCGRGSEGCGAKGACGRNGRWEKADLQGWWCGSV